MNKKFGFVKYLDYFGGTQYEIWNNEEYGINLVKTEILFESDDYNEVVNFKNNYGI